jgi:SAM-dependent methyltransferase
MAAFADNQSILFRSFRDPAGRLVRTHDRIFRTVEPEFSSDLESFLATRTGKAAMDAGHLVRTVRVDASTLGLSGVDCGNKPVYEHERIPFPSYPYEWPPEMLHAAAMRTLDLGLKALEEGFGLKDATPYNVLYRGAEPVFVDVLSFERRNPLDPYWTAYAQFVRTFLLPLLAQRSFGSTLQQIFSGQRDGLEPEVVHQQAGVFQRLKPPFLSLVTLPKLMGARRDGDESIYQAKESSSPEQARFILEGLMRRSLKQLDALAPRPPADSVWTGYLDHKSLYSPAQLAQKQRFFEQALEFSKPALLLDVGANEGRFSFLAARHGASVVAIDTDPAVVGSMWRHASQEKLDVLPLVVDLTRPSPATGWRNQECPSFLERAGIGSGGGFDMVSMLAVMHHILITERIPMEDLLDLADQLSRRDVLIEFVGPEDPMFRRILRGRERLYTNISRASFEAAAEARFELLRSEQIDGLHRWLYLYRRRTATR